MNAAVAKTLTEMSNTVHQADATHDIIFLNSSKPKFYRKCLMSKKVLMMKTRYK